MNTEIQVLFVSASAADEAVLATLLAREEGAAELQLAAASTAQAFFDAMYAERSYQLIVIDERQSWSDWQSVVASCAKSHPNAMLVLLSAGEVPAHQEAALGVGIAAVYPRSSAGLLPGFEVFS